jgi:hypothetical protein
LFWIILITHVEGMTFKVNKKGILSLEHRFFSSSFGVFIEVDLRNGLNTSIPTHMSNSYNFHEITTNILNWHLCWTISCYAQTPFHCRCRHAFKTYINQNQAPHLPIAFVKKVTMPFVLPHNSHVLKPWMSKRSHEMRAFWWTIIMHPPSMF